MQMSVLTPTNISVSTPTFLRCRCRSVSRTRCTIFFNYGVVLLSFSAGMISEPGVPLIACCPRCQVLYPLPYASHEERWSEYPAFLPSLKEPQCSGLFLSAFTSQFSCHEIIYHVNNDDGFFHISILSSRQAFADVRFFPSISIISLE